MVVCSDHKLLCIGRGMKNGENFKLLYDLADKLGAGGTHTHTHTYTHTRTCTHTHMHTHMTHTHTHTHMYCSHFRALLMQNTLAEMIMKFIAVMVCKPQILLQLTAIKESLHN